MTWFRVTAHADVADVAITDEIREGDAGRFLAALPRSARTIRLHVTSAGGAAGDGLAIAQGLRAHPARVHVVVAGLAASAATLPICAGDRVQIERDAIVMLHEPHVVPRAGDGVRAGELRDAAAALERLRAQMVATYGWRLKHDGPAIAALMKATTWWSAEDAVRAGLGDEVVAGSAAGAHFSVAAVAKLGRVPRRFERAITALTRSAGLDVAALYRRRLNVRGPYAELPTTRGERCAVACVAVADGRQDEPCTAACVGAGAVNAVGLDSIGIYRRRAIAGGAA